MTYVNILSKPYEIVYAKDAQVASSLMGSCNRSMQRIMIVGDIGKEQIEDTLIHEVLHIIGNELGIGIKEADIMRMAVGLYSAGVRIPLMESTNSVQEGQGKIVDR